MLGLRPLTGFRPGFLDRFGHFKRCVWPIQRFTDAYDFLGAIGAAMGLARAGKFRRAETDDRFDGQENRLLLLGRPFQGSFDVFLVMAVYPAADPARSFKTRTLIRRVGKVGAAINRHSVVVEQHNELVQLHVTGQRDRFLAEALHEAAIPSDHPGAVINKLIAEAGVQVALCYGHAHRCRDALPQRARCRFHAGRHEILRMPRRIGAHLAEVADVIAADRGIARQVKQRIDQHRPVARRKHEPVAVGPVRVFRIKLQELAEENGCRVRHAERQAHMA